MTIFLVRVAAQPLALAIDARVLPPFDAWHSGLVPYGVLLASQLVIVAVAYRSIRGLASGTTQARRRTGLMVMAAGSAYFAVMLARLVLGATVLSGHSWFARPLPTAFHLVLAAFLLVYGHFHVTRGARRETGGHVC